VLDLRPYKDTIKALSSGQYNTEGKINLYCWLGERAHLLIAEIERLRTQNMTKEAGR
jgi:uncharacterized small protein (DUF1192 family)